ncbi:MAG: UDP-N-acetylglucosamine 2-epimerase (non-hydrolyzing) [Rubrobacter sp.]|nr:UDP-N-acetylglucosamine 2-epimerase (non-hydrolyzing) [Rubrobacter sp.]
MTKALLVAGARPNFMKVDPVLRALRAYPRFQMKLVHTGQHYDPAMSDVFFKQLGLPHPDIYLGVGSGTQASQTAKIMVAFEEVVHREQPDLVIVVGDVNSTLAAALVTAKAVVPLAHVEAGLRNFDRTLPEEINRMVTDTLSEILFTTMVEANENLLHEGHPKEQIYFVGNTMIDTLLRHKATAQNLHTLKKLGLSAGKYLLATLHRPHDVDAPENLRAILEALVEAPLPVVFPVHPRTEKVARRAGMDTLLDKAGAMQALGYLDFLSLQMHAALVLTDSGGVQEETTALGVRCLTLRENTERPVTISRGTNRLIGKDPSRIVEEVERAIEEPPVMEEGPPMWDGHAGERIAAVLDRLF